MARENWVFEKRFQETLVAFVETQVVTVTKVQKALKSREGAEGRLRMCNKIAKLKLFF